MLDLLVYLLPLSGELLLQELLELDDVRIQTALLPENFFNESQELVPLLEKNDIRYMFPSGSLDNEKTKNWICQKEHDLGVSIGYDKKLPAWLIEYPPLKNINIHPSLLPRYRGANPYFWALRNRETTTGVTLHFMDENFDTGPIIRQEKISLDSHTLMGELFMDLNHLGSQMAGEVVETIAKDNSLPEATAQSELEDPPEAPRVTDRHLKIDWSENFREIDALVRAANPFFGAYSLFKGQKLKIYEIERAGDIEKENNNPGRIITTERGPVVNCGDGWGRLTNVALQYNYKLSGKEFQRREKNNLEILKNLV